MYVAQPHFLPPWETLLQTCRAKNEQASAELLVFLQLTFHFITEIYQCHVYNEKTPVKTGAFPIDFNFSQMCRFAPTCSLTGSGHLTTTIFGKPIATYALSYPQLVANRGDNVQGVRIARTSFAYEANGTTVSPTPSLPLKICSLYSEHNENDNLCILSFENIYLYAYYIIATLRYRPSA